MKKIKINQATAGGILFLGSMQWFIVVMVTESLFPNYSVRVHALSDLASTIVMHFSQTGSPVSLFNVSTILLGATVLISAIIIHPSHRYSLFTALFSLSGLTAIGFGLIPENSGSINAQFFSIWFGTLSLSAISSFLLVKKPFAYLSLFIGIFSLMVLLLVNVLGIALPFISLGKGGEEGLIVYPLILWMVALGAYLMGKPESYGKRGSK